MNENESTQSLTDKQKRFCEEYIIDLNGAQAAIRTGYAEGSARIQASQLLTNPNIQDYLQELKAQISERNKITVDEIVSILANVARFDIAELYDKDGNMKDIHSIPIEHRQAISEISSFEEYVGKGVEREAIGMNRKIKADDRQAAIDKLMKHLGGYEKDNGQKTDSVVTIFELPNDKRN